MMSDINQNPEQIARDNIDRMLRDVGWEVQDKDKIDFSSGSGIAVREYRNLMRNNLTQLPWREGQFILVENYLEAVGVMNALKAGVTMESIRRPITATKVRIATEQQSESRQAKDTREEITQFDS